MIKTVKGFGRPDVKNKCYLGSNPHKIHPGSMIAYHNLHKFCQGNTVQTTLTNEYSMFNSPKVHASQVIIQVTCGTSNFVINQAILLGKTYSNKQITLATLSDLQVKNLLRYNFTFTLKQPGVQKQFRMDQIVAGSIFRDKPPSTDPHYPKTRTQDP